MSTDQAHPNLIPSQIVTIEVKWPWHFLDTNSSVNEYQADLDQILHGVCTIKVYNINCHQWKRGSISVAIIIVLIRWELFL